MKKLILFLLFISVQNCIFANELLEPVGISKYAVLEVKNDNTPLRVKNSESSSRLSHFYKDTVLFADKQNKDYYRVELENGFYGWINKKFVEVQGIIPEKRFENIEKITFSENKKNHIVKIEVDNKSAFVLNEDKNNIDFTLYDSYFDPVDTKIIIKNKDNYNFEYNEKFDSKFSLKYLNSKPLFGYNVSPWNKGYILKIKKVPKIKKNKPLKNIIIVVDPGHGGCEKGACAFDLEEKNINLQISKKLSKELKKKGAKVYLTRTKDKKTGLYERVAFAKQKEADILLSIHQNSLPNPKDVYKKHGVGTYYYNAQSKPLAESIQKALIEATNFKDDKVNHASFALTRPTSQISVLIECGYIIKKEEAEKISDKNFQKIIAQAIAIGCENYLKTTFLNIDL